MQRFAEGEIDFGRAIDFEIMFDGDGDDIQAGPGRRQHGEIRTERLRKTGVDPFLFVRVETGAFARRDRIGQTGAHGAHAGVIALHGNRDIEVRLGVIEQPAREIAQRRPNHQQRIDLRVAIYFSIETFDDGPHITAHQALRARC